MNVFLSFFFFHWLILTFVFDEEIYPCCMSSTQIGECIASNIYKS